MAGLLLLAGCAVFRPAGAAEADTLGLRFELGATSDLTNELYYEDAFIDTTFLGRQRISTPENRVAGVFLAGLDGTRGGGTSRYDLQNELRLGDKLQQNVLQLTWNDDFAPDWRFSLNPRVEYRADRTFDRDLQEWRGAASARLRRAFADGNTFADVRARGEYLRTSGLGADFIPDRDALGLGAGVDHMPLFGTEWHVGYRIDARQFPDSSVRDHFEHGVDANLKFGQLSGRWLALEAASGRRVTMNEAPTSRDNFWQEWTQAELGMRLGEAWQLRARAEFEGLQYDVQDSTVYFNYRIFRARLGPRYDRFTGISAAAGPAAEMLRSPLSPAEDYDEVGGFLELEWLGAGGWWSVSPAAGWRQYGTRSSDPDGLDLHTSYAYYELALFGDQRMPGDLRLRTVASARAERHSDPANDATSLYFSVDVRRLF